jgi:glycosyltransferase involved in cell wall biosynthesis
MGVSIVIPSRNEKFLNNTILDVLKNATGEIEVFPVLDGYLVPENELIKDPRVHYLHLEPDGKKLQKRQGVNLAVSLSKYEYIMCLDAHCMVGKYFDEILARDCEPNWVVVPRRYKLDALNWCVNDDQPPVDYEYWMWRYLMGERGSHGFPELHDYRWDERHFQRKHIPIDDKMTMQASCWFMAKDWFLKNDIFNPKGYTGWGQEAEQICLTTWTEGGRVVVNKKTWYAHLYKGKLHGRMYFMSKAQRDESMHYSYNYWVRERRDDFIKVVNKFMPVPNFPEDWPKYLK